MRTSSFVHSAVTAAQDSQIVLPWARGERRAELIARRRDFDIRQRRSA